jgi:hypothetical protein
MLKRSALAVLALLLASWPVMDAEAKPGPPRADLKMTAVSASYADGLVTVTFTLENRGVKNAKATQTWIRYFKSPTKVGPQDVGFVATPPIRRGHSKTLTATFPGDRVPSGEVSILACADFGRDVKQHKLKNDCKYAAPIVLPAEVVVTYGPNDAAGGSVSGTSTRGSCTTFGANGPNGATGACDVRPGGTVTLTATPAANYFFASWAAASGKTCDGTVSGSQISFTSPTAAQDCVANFQHNP